MKFLHISDLHIGKVVNDFSMLDDQQFILDQIAGMAQANQVDAVVIAGDVYDRAIPSGEAVTLLDKFLTELSVQGIQVLMISGNHDSPERLSFGRELLGRQGVHIAGVQEEKLVTVEFRERMQDSLRKEFVTQFVLLPFLKPAQVQAATSGEAVEKVLAQYWEQEKKNGRKKKNRVLVTHFFVTDSGREPELSDSETTIHVGGLDNVEISVFKKFDYVALGHIHKPQQIGSYPVWYAGSPLKYSFGETKQEKCALLVHMGENGLEEVRKLSLRPMRQMRKISGSLQELLAKGQEDTGKQDYIQANLLDEGELIDPIGVLRSVYPHVMQIVRMERQDMSELGFEASGSRRLAEKRDVLALFADFYQEVRGEALTEEGRKIVENLVKELEGQKGTKT